jgi:hypothetical protein
MDAQVAGVACLQVRRDLKSVSLLASNQDSQAETPNARAGHNEKDSSIICRRNILRVYSCVSGCEKRSESQSLGRIDEAMACDMRHRRQKHQVFISFCAAISSSHFILTRRAENLFRRVAAASVLLVMIGSTNDTLASV